MARFKQRKISLFAIKRAFAKVFNFKNFLVLLLLIIIAFLVGPLTVNYMISKRYEERIYSEQEQMPDTRVAIVFGAGLTNNGSEPGKILEDRILAAVDLYKQGKVQKIIMTGDGISDLGYSEPDIMVSYAIENGVSELDLIADIAGRRTYDSCYRAKEIYQLNSAILITQEYHLPRALYLCNTLGIDSYGYIADKQIYTNIRQYELREFFAVTLAFWEIYVQEPDVILD